MEHRITHRARSPEPFAKGKGRPNQLDAKMAEPKAAFRGECKAHTAMHRWDTARRSKGRITGA